MISSTVKILFFAFSGMAFLGSFSCKMNSDNDLRTIDNFAANDKEPFYLNSCKLDRNILDYADGTNSSPDDKIKWVNAFFSEPNHFSFAGMGADDANSLKDTMLQLALALPPDVVTLLRDQKVKIHASVDSIENECAQDVFKEKRTLKAYACTIPKEDGKLHMYFAPGSVKSFDKEEKPFDLEMSLEVVVEHSFIRQFMVAAHTEWVSQTEGKVALTDYHNKIIDALKEDLKGKGLPDLQALSDEDLYAAFAIEIRDSLHCSRETSDLFKAEYRKTAEAILGVVQ